MKRRLLSAFLAVMMVLTMAPVAFAGDEDAENTAVSSTSGSNDSAVAKIGDTGYATLQAAVDAANNDDTVTLVKDTDQGFAVPAGLSITFDVNGKTLERTGQDIQNNGTLIIRDNTKQGKIIANGGGVGIAIGVGNDSVTTIEYANVEAVEGAVITGKATGATITIEDGVFSTSDNAVIAGNGTKREGNANVITINGGTFTGNIKSTGYIACGIYAPWKDIITVNDGNFTVNNGIGIVARAGQVTVNGGTFTCTGSAKGGVGDKKFDMDAAQCVYFDASNPAYPAYNSETDYIKLQGGKFSSDVSAYVAKGYVQNENGTVEQLGETNAVAKVGNTYYKTLSAAVAVAQSGATVKLLANINGQTVIPADKNIVLDLNGKTMTHTGTTLYNSGTLVVKDSSADKSGKIVSTGNVGIGVNHNSTTTIEYANIQAQEGAVITGYATGATITIEDGVFTALDNAVVAGNGNKTDKNTEGTPERVNANKITINGGTFTGNIQSSGYIACGIYAPWKDIITVNGGDFTVNNGIGIVARAGQVTVNGGRFICNGSAKGKVGDKKFDMDAAQILYFDASNPAYPAYNSATDYIKVTGGLFAAAFNNAYCADGKAVVPNTDAATKDVYPYTVGTVEENVEVSPAAPEAKAETTGKETTVADAMTSIAQNIQNNGATTEGLEAVGGQEANKVTTDEVTAAKTELAKTVSVADKTVTVYVQPYLDITVKDAKVSADNENAPYSVTLDIVPMVKKVASTAENADAIALSGNNKNAVVLENKEVTVTTPVTITIKLPDNFAISDVSTIKVKHEKNGVLVGYHDATVDKENRTVTFTNDKGFSTFTILSDSRSTSISFDGEAAVSYGPSNVNDALPTKTAPSGKVFKGWSFEGVNGTYTTLTDDLLTALDGKTAVKATSVFDNKSSGGSSGSSSGKTTYKVTTSAVNNGGVNASPSTAEKGATITLTLSPDKGYKLDKLTVTDGSGKSVSTVKKSDTVYTFTMPASAVKVGVSYVKATETPSETKFNDVSANDWFASAVDYVTGKGMMNGTAANTFSPKANTTRGMLMTVLARHAGEDTTGGSVWYEKGMNWAKANGVSDGTNPQVNITREQLAAMLYRYAQNKKYDVSGAKSLDGYTDAQSVSSYAVPALQWANAAGVVNGKSGSKLDPKGYATRAEVAAMLMRFCENVEK